MLSLGGIHFDESGSWSVEGDTVTTAIRKVAQAIAARHDKEVSAKHSQGGAGILGASSLGVLLSLPTPLAI